MNRSALKLETARKSGYSLYASNFYGKLCSLKCTDVTLISHTTLKTNIRSMYIIYYNINISRVEIDWHEMLAVILYVNIHTIYYSLLAIALSDPKIFYSMKITIQQWYDRPCRNCKPQLTFCIFVTQTRRNLYSTLFSVIRVKSKKKCRLPVTWLLFRYQNSLE